MCVKCEHIESGPSHIPWPHYSVVHCIFLEISSPLEWCWKSPQTDPYYYWFLWGIVYNSFKTTAIHTHFVAYFIALAIICIFISTPLKGWCYSLSFEQFVETRSRAKSSLKHVHYFYKSTH